MRGPGLVLAALGLLAFALYARSLGFPGLELSDAATRSFRSLGEAAHRGGLGALTLFLERTGDSVLLSRVVALGLHAAACMLVFVLARRLALAPISAAGLAGLFAVHPLRAAAVLWVSQRGVLLASVLLLLAAVLVFGRSPEARRTRAAGALLAALVAVFAEPRFFAFLPWLLLALRWRRPAPAHSLIGDAVLVLVGASVWMASPHGLALPVQAPAAVLAQAWQWFWPAAPVVAGSSSFTSPWSTAASGLALLLGIAACFRVRRSAPLVALGGLLFVLLAGTPALSERALDSTTGYLAAFGLELALVAALEPVLARRATLLPGGLMLGLLALHTLVQLPAWSSEPTLQAAMLAARPMDAHAHEVLGQWHFAHGRLGAAQREFERLALVAPEVAEFRLGELELRRGLLPGQGAHLLAAREHLRACAALPGAPPRAHARLGEVEQRLGAAEDARAELTLAAREDPFDVESATRLGMVLRDLGELADARLSFERALAVDARAPEAWCGLGLVRQQQNEAGPAEDAFRRALALEPDHPESNAALARLLEQRGERAVAEACYRRAVSVNPGYDDALYGLGALLASASASNDAAADEALRYLDRVVALHPPPRPHVRASLASARLRLARGEREVPRTLLTAVLAFNPAQPEAQELLRQLDGRDEEKR